MELGELCVSYLTRSGYNFTSFIQSHIASFVLLLSAWVRYAGTARSLPKRGAYALIITGQVRTPP
jgi:hypothetical protein